MADHEERRRFTRIHFDGSTVLYQGSRADHVELIDISLDGALVESDFAQDIAEDQPLTLTIKLNNESEISMEAGLVHRQDRSLGLRCLNIDMESMTHLRRLIELNLNDPSAPERVLDQLLQRSI